MTKNELKFWIWIQGPKLLFSIKNRNSNDSAACSDLTDILHETPAFTPVVFEDHSIHTPGLPRPIQFHGTYVHYNLHSGNDPSDWSLEGTDYLLKSGIVHHTNRFNMASEILHVKLVMRYESKMFIIAPKIR